MLELLKPWPLWKLQALIRIAKTRGKVFFRDPNTMKELRHTLKLMETAE